MLRMTWVNKCLHATGIAPAAPSQSLVNLFLHMARKLYLRGVIKL